MTTFVNAFGSSTVPPAQQQYRAVALSASVSLSFPLLTDSSDVMSSIMDVTASAGSLAIALPDASTGTPGFDTLIRNVGATTFSVTDSSGGAVTTVLAGESKYVYLADNSSVAGTWKVFTFGTGTSSADASALAGQGLSVGTGLLTVDAPVTTQSGSTSLVASSSRGELTVFTAGSVTCNLPSVATATNGYYTDIANHGSGTVTVDNTDGALIDGATSKALSPSESARFYTDGTSWYTVGYGRSAQFIFTKLVKDITTGSPFTLSSAECSNKLFQFIGTASADVTVNVPEVVSIYYVQCAFSGAYTLTIKTTSGTGVALANVARTILYCDGTNVVDAQTVPASTILAMTDGTEFMPSLYYSGDTDTGFYRVSSNTLGITAGGTRSASFTPTGINDTAIGTTAKAAGGFTTLTATGAVSFTTPLSVANGGTALSSYTVGDIIYASGATAISKLADVATGNALISGGVGVAPSYGKIGLTSHVSGILPVANGGTNSAYFTVAGPSVARTYTFPDATCTVLTSNTPVTVSQGGTGVATLTANAVLLGNGGSAIQSVAPSTAGNVLTSNGTTWQSTAPSAASAFASGTRLAFNQSSAPTGWTKDTTFNDSIMRVVSGTVGNGGSVAFSTFNAQTTTGAHTLTSSEIANHTHDMSLSSSLEGSFNAGEYISSNSTNTIFAAGTSGGTITVGASGGGTGHSHSLTHGIKYNDFIIATKD